MSRIRFQGYREGTIAITTMIALSACADEAQPLSKETIAERAARLTAPQPGLYRTTSELVNFELPNAPPPEAERMRHRFGFVEPQVAEACLTAEEAARGFLPLLDAMQDGTCQFIRFDTGETSLDALMQCESANGTISQAEMTGETSTSASSLETRIEQRGEGLPGGEMRFTLLVETMRLGSCAGEGSGIAGN
ncbi:DUF3617 domain-containing protein [Aurantiacibacter poecillastricola]|uniref:DUF3617 domain-containing protein n=1 Tax=Aurantiacibacter poecillastricola TaxID=3064385 RepID=UPI00273D3C19|nr:DUF3617 family protein [Aurantiacibacter sp. 219JJ12-13]MDP5261444.1 DUF3617 family protein [Aurantiacibacter sp. 219JJ12-13]